MTPENIAYHEEAFKLHIANLNLQGNKLAQIEDKAESFMFACKMMGNNYSITCEVLAIACWRIKELEAKLAAYEKETSLSA